MKAVRQPEDVLVDFLLASLRGDEKEIRPLILDHPDAALLWQGAYPPEVAVLLAEVYRDAEIVRVEDEPDRVVLQFDAFPHSLHLVEGEWRVDASQIIAFRKRARGNA